MKEKAIPINEKAHTNNGNEEQNYWPHYIVGV
jgi:hypothetical protein